MIATCLSAFADGLCAYLASRGRPLDQDILITTFAVALGALALLRSAVAGLTAERWRNGHRLRAAGLFLAMMPLSAASLAAPMLLFASRSMPALPVEFWIAMGATWLLVDVSATVLPMLQPASESPVPATSEAVAARRTHRKHMPPTRAALWAHLVSEASTAAAMQTPGQPANGEAAYVVTTTQRTLAAALGVGKSTINRWLRDLAADGLVTIAAGLTETKITVHMRAPQVH
jgi:hypothetical protein